MTTNTRPNIRPNTNTLADIGKRDSTTGEVVFTKLDHERVATQARLLARANGTQPEIEEAHIWDRIYKTPIAELQQAASTFAKAATAPKTKTPTEKKVEKLATKIQKAEGCNAMEAIDRAWRRNPQLHTQFLDEHNAALRAQEFAAQAVFNVLHKCACPAETEKELGGQEPPEDVSTDTDDGDEYEDAEDEAEEETEEEESARLRAKAQRIAKQLGVRLATALPTGTRAPTTTTTTLKLRVDPNRKPPT